MSENDQVNGYDPDEPGKLMRVDVSGAKPSLWVELRPKLLESIKEILAQPIDVEGRRTVEGELRDLTTGLLDFAKAKLALPAAEVEKVMADVAKTYAERQKELAQARRDNAEAAAIEERLRVQRLRKKLGLLDAMLAGEKDEESLLIGKKLKAMLKFLKELQQTQ